MNVRKQNGSVRWIAETAERRDLLNAVDNSATLSSTSRHCSVLLRCCCCFFLFFVLLARSSWLLLCLFSLKSYSSLLRFTFCLTETLSCGHNINPFVGITTQISCLFLNPLKMITSMRPSTSKTPEYVSMETS